MELKFGAADEADSVVENGQSLAFFGKVFPRPAGVVGTMQERFGMRHQSEEPSCVIADAGNGVR